MSTPTITEDRVEGKKCPECFATVCRIEVTDCRPDYEQRRRPLKEAEKTMLWCRCNHPGDCMVGGFF